MNEEEHNLQYAQRLARKHELENKAHNLHLAFVTSIAQAVMPSGFWRSNRHPRQSLPALHLTYDDGPHPQTTPQLLELLDEFGVKATFFFIGTNMEKYPQLVLDALEHGHEVANHTMNHRFLLALSTREIEKEIDRATELLLDLSGAKTRLFRPPFGLLDNRVTRVLHERRLGCVFWGAMASDWKPIGEDKVVKRIFEQLLSQDLIVLHEGPEIASQCLKATRLILEKAASLEAEFAPII
jgi:peptidoglycan/xylan/chitin deacetylase (PgdA/CDA1 family)